jgi:hypothetical protein
MIQGRIARIPPAASDDAALRTLNSISGLYASGRFAEDERDARKMRRGMWQGCFVAPRDFRRWNNRTAVVLGEGCLPDALATLFQPILTCRPAARSRESMHYVRWSPATAGSITCTVAQQMASAGVPFPTLALARCHRLPLGRQRVGCDQLSSSFRCAPVGVIPGARNLLLSRAMEGGNAGRGYAADDPSLENLGLMGAMLLIMATGPGPGSLDERS